VGVGSFVVPKVGISLARRIIGAEDCAVQLQVGHTKLESLRYLGIEVDEALEMAEQTEG
jgi:hypothetical protein